MVEGGRSFTCNKCGAVFDSLERLMAHNRTHVQGSTVVEFTCTICGTRLGDRVKLLEHVRWAHGI